MKLKRLYIWHLSKSLTFMIDFYAWAIPFNVDRYPGATGWNYRFRFLCLNLHVQLVYKKPMEQFMYDHEFVEEDDKDLELNQYYRFAEDDGGELSQYEDWEDEDRYYDDYYDAILYDEYDDVVSSAAPINKCET